MDIFCRHKMNYIVSDIPFVEMFVFQFVISFSLQKEQSVNNEFFTIQNLTNNIISRAKFVSYELKEIELYFCICQFLH